MWSPFLSTGRAPTSWSTPQCRDAQVPCKLELLFLPGGYFETDHTVTQAMPGGSVLLREGAGRYVLDYEAIEVAGGEAYHFYTRTMRGSLPLPDDRFAVYTTFFTPHCHRLTLSPASVIPKLPPMRALE